MESLGTQTLVDEAGKPLDPRLQQVLWQLLPKLRARYPQLVDDVLATEILEVAGQHICAHQRTGAPVKSLEAYAWVVAINAARSRLRRSSMRLVHSTLSGEDSDTLLALMASGVGTKEEIESAILEGELMAHLSPKQRLLCVLKKMGFSSREIAEEQQTTVADIDTQFYRIKRKIRAVLQDRGTADPWPSTSQPSKPRTA
jgi:RNA polymerase sigma factor (sigma-70 family)